MSTKTLNSIADITISEKTVQIVTSDPVSPAASQLWLNSTTNQLKYFNGTETILINPAWRLNSSVKSFFDTPIEITDNNIDWSLGRMFYANVPFDLNNNVAVSYSFSNVTDKEIIFVIKPSVDFYNNLTSITVNFNYPYYTDNYNINTVYTTLPSLAYNLLFFISSKQGKIYIKWYKVDSGQAQLTSKTIWSWGTNTAGQIGDNTATNRSSPVLVSGGFWFTKVISIEDGCCMGLRQDGRVMTWGLNSSGQLGDGTVSNGSSPDLVIGGHSFINIGGCNNAGLALKADGSLWSWGLNSSGQLGDGTASNGSSPDLVIGNISFIKVFQNFDATAFAQSGDGQLWAWGNGTAGQLGNNTTTSSISSPILTIGNHSFVDVRGTTDGTVIGLKFDGSVWSWGFNSHGGLGNNTIINRSSPVQITGSHSFIKIATGGYHCLALKSDGSLWAWGCDPAHNFGQLGTNNTLAYSSPVQVIGNHSFISLGCSTLTSSALKVNGSIWSWGNNSAGEVGDNTTYYRSSPVAVIGGHTFGALDSGPIAKKR